MNDFENRALSAALVLVQTWSESGVLPDIAPHLNFDEVDALGELFGALNYTDDRDALYESWIESEDEGQYEVRDGQLVDTRNDPSEGRWSLWFTERPGAQVQFIDSYDTYIEAITAEQLARVDYANAHGWSAEPFWQVVDNA